jgi:hypothetical protein
MCQFVEGERSGTDGVLRRAWTVEAGGVADQAVAEQAASAKEDAAKAAADKAAAEQAASELAVAEQVDAEKAASDLAAAEKEAAEKAGAETSAAAEQAAAEKGAAYEISPEDLKRVAAFVAEQVRQSFPPLTFDPILSCPVSFPIPSCSKVLLLRHGTRQAESATVCFQI